MRNIFLGIFVLVLFSCGSLAQGNAPEDDCLYYFYGIDCPQCIKANEYIDDLQAKYPSLHIEKLEVYQRHENAKLLQDYFTAHAVSPEAQGIPVVLLPNTYLVGSTPIASLLEGAVKENVDPSCSGISASPWVGVVGEKAPHDVFKTLTFVGVTSAAVSDSLSPGLLAVLLILLSVIVMIKDEVVMIQRTAMFIVASFVAYLLLGFGLLTWFNHATAYVLFYKIIGVIALIVGVMRVRTFFLTWKVWREHVAEKTELGIAKVKSYLTSPLGMLALGFLGALLTSARLSKVFLILQSLLAAEELRFAAVPLLLYYVIMLALPLIVVVAVLHLMREKQREYALKHTENFSSDVKRARWKKHNQMIFRFAVSSFMVVVGLVLVFV